MMKKRNIFYFSFLVCFLIILSSCEAEREFINNAEDGKNLKRQITFGQFKNEIGQPRFSKRFSLATNANARSIADFEVDTTLVKSLESNYIVYSMNLEPKFEVSDDKFYNLVVYKDYSNEVVKQIVEYSPQNAIFPVNDFETSNFLQSTATEVIYSSRSSVEPICTEVVTVDRCYCANHTVAECGGCSQGFRPVTELVIVPCSTGGAEPDPLPDPYYPDETGDTGGGNDGAVSVDPVLLSYDQASSTPCQELKKNSLSNNLKTKLQILSDNINGTVEKTFGIYNGLLETPIKDNPNCGNILSGTSAETATITYKKSLKAIAHNHLKDSSYNHIGTFTPLDILQLNNLAIEGENQQSLVTKIEFASYLVCNEGNYCLKINDLEKLYNFSVKYVNDDDFFNEINEYYKDNNIIHGKETELQNVGFLKFLRDFDLGIDYYEADENFENWKKLNIDFSPTNNIIKTPC